MAYYYSVEKHQTAGLVWSWVFWSGAKITGLRHVVKCQIWVLFILIVLKGSSAPKAQARGQLCWLWASELLQKRIRANWSKCWVENNSSFQNYPNTFRDYRYMVLPQNFTIPYFYHAKFQILHSFKLLFIKLTTASQYLHVHAALLNSIEWFVICPLSCCSGNRQGVHPGSSC